ncbi:Uncharacterised protein [uncultured archaeon]|nr:Uncharacterised protein [uncultured archaeon]
MHAGGNGPGLIEETDESGLILQDDPLDLKRQLQLGAVGEPIVVDSAVDVINHISLAAADIDPGACRWHQALFGGHLHENKVGLAHGLNQRLLLVASGVSSPRIGEIIENPGYFFSLRRSPLGHCLYPLNTISKIPFSSSSANVNLSLA